MISTKVNKAINLAQSIKSDLKTKVHPTYSTKLSIANGDFLDLWKIEYELDLLVNQLKELYEIETVYELNTKPVKSYDQTSLNI